MKSANRKKILHLITGLEVGGAEMNLVKIVPELNKNFDNIVCCIKGHGISGERLEEKGIRVYYLDVKNVFDFFNPIIINKFRKIIKDFKPDIFETYLIHADLFGRIWGRLFGIKKIVCNHRGSLLEWNWLEKIDKLTSFLVTKYVFQTKAAQKEISKKIKISQKKSTVIPNTIDISRYNLKINRKKKLQQLGIKNDNLNIVSVSNLRIGKGHKYLLKAFEKYYSKNKKINLIIVGDGKERVNLEKQIKSYNSKNSIFFLGTRNDVLEILKISDVFVLPTFYEGMSNAVMEAMASKLPIITTNIAVNKELLKNNGLLVPIKNSKEITKNFKKLISSPDLRKQLGEKAQKDIKANYSPQKIAGKITALITNL